LPPLGQGDRDICGTETDVGQFVASFHCEVCTFDNIADATHCELCKSAKNCFENCYEVLEQLCLEQQFWIGVYEEDRKIQAKEAEAAARKAEQAVAAPLPPGDEGLSPLEPGRSEAGLGGPCFEVPRYPWRHATHGGSWRLVPGDFLVRFPHFRRFSSCDRPPGDGTPKGAVAAPLPPLGQGDRDICGTETDVGQFVASFHCEVCTFDNIADATHCEVCKSAKNCFENCFEVLEQLCLEQQFWIGVYEEDRKIQYEEERKAQAKEAEAAARKAECFLCRNKKKCDLVATKGGSMSNKDLCLAAVHLRAQADRFGEDGTPFQWQWSDERPRQAIAPLEWNPGPSDETFQWSDERPRQGIAPLEFWPRRTRQRTGLRMSSHAPSSSSS